MSPYPRPHILTSSRPDRSPAALNPAVLKQTLRATAVLAVVAAIAAPAAVAAPAPDAAPAAPPVVVASVSTTPPPTPGQVRVSALKGEARVGYEVGEDEVRVAVNARATYQQGSIPTASWGTFRISHVQQGKLAWGEFKVDCLTTGGPNATVTGRLVRTSPDHPWTKLLEPHTRMGVSFSVPKNGTSYVGLSGATYPNQPLLTRCMTPAADMPVIEGGYLFHR